MTCGVQGGPVESVRYPKVKRVPTPLPGRSTTVPADVPGTRQGTNGIPLVLNRRAKPVSVGLHFVLLEMSKSLRAEEYEEIFPLLV